MIYLSGRVLPDHPAMKQPGMGNRLPPGQLWAADHGTFNHPEKFSLAAYLIWLNEFAANGDAERCLFATAPDVWADAAATLERARPCMPYIQDIGYKVALVAQDGLEDLEVPWDEFDCLFLGGTTKWKVGEAAYALAQEAKAQDKWLHMGPGQLAAENAGSRAVSL